MTIIVTTPVANASGASGPSGSSAAAGGAAEGAAGNLFASLLGVQMSAIGSLLPGLGDGGTGAGKPDDDKPNASPGDASAQAALAMPLLAALQLQQAPVTPAQQPTQQTQDKAPVQDLLAQPSATHLPIQDLQAQQATPKVDPTLLLPVGKQGFNWQSSQQKLPDPDQTAAQFLPLQQLQQPQQSNQAQAAASANMPQLTLPQTLNDPNWGKALGEQVLSMVSLKMDKAQIQLNPPQMGPIEITLKMNGTDQAQVLFTAAVPATREALENNMHRLSSMLSSSGIQLTDSQVSSGNSGQQQQAFQQKRGRQDAGLPEVDGVDALASIKAARGILSIFA
ncbi:flagellar hook-length control protein FliK [Chromobacterium sp. ASV23]|uniref:flagellar hook-length control protein FliK n=1 Tax=Chromobacterium sp. ASV23 TaxID=2795110 RepID=UPI0018EC24C2|nr:flagellar hook-length control protein FliK [Chromobacterium sp. ASV23]